VYCIDLNGKVAVVTGAGGGIGRAISLALAQAGATVALADSNLQSANKTFDEVVFAGGRATTYRCDVKRESHVMQVAYDVVSHYGRIDIVVNAAGIWMDGTLTALTPLQTGTLLETNQLGPLYMTRAAWSYLSVNGGVVINIGSIQAHGIYVQPGFYNTTKAALEGITQATAVEGGPLGIRAVCVAPGAMSGTGMSGAPPEIIDALRRSVPVGRRGLPEEVAHAVVMACAPQASYINGTTITVDGGLSCERRPVTMLPPRLVADDPDVDKHEVDDSDA
jgi:NAD(P)-dependent dehydrogenase (short-subunit alcohol dehydrogenase family)